MFIIIYLFIMANFIIGMLSEENTTKKWWSKHIFRKIGPEDNI